LYYNIIAVYERNKVGIY